jgi:hypothetical protein
MHQTAAKSCNAWNRTGPLEGAAPVVAGRLLDIVVLLPPLVDAVFPMRVVLPVEISAVLFLLGVRPLLVTSALPSRLLTA